jgi:Holliday junction resolvasome RuvABC endonuclease subunit
MPNIIAIDTGLQRLGYCHLRYNDTGFELKNYGTFETSNKDCRGKRLYNIRQFLLGELFVIPNYSFKDVYEFVNFLVYEYPCFTNKTSQILGTVIGVIESSYFEYEYKEALSISPTEVKKKIFGKGTASKNQVKIGVIRKLQEYNIELDLSKELDDTIDAIAIALVTYEDLKSDINP